MFSVFLVTARDRQGFFDVFNISVGIPYFLAGTFKNKGKDENCNKEVPDFWLFFESRWEKLR